MNYLNISTSFTDNQNKLISEFFRKYGPVQVDNVKEEICQLIVKILIEETIDILFSDKFTKT